MKIFHSDQIKQIDKLTINDEPVSSIDLMERAAMEIFKWYTSRFERTNRVVIFTGPGNNGGDGLALARLLADDRYEIDVYYIRFTENTSEDWKENRRRLEKFPNVPFRIISKEEEFPVLYPGDVVIDAIFGTGLSRPVKGLPASVIKQINAADHVVVAIDIPSGLLGEDNSENISENVIRASYTVSFEFPKLSFFFAENEKFTGDWVVLPIGLSRDAIENISTPYSYIKIEDIAPFIRKRKKFDHKGLFGHGLLISGSYGKTGAAVLAAKGALRTGIGLLTCHVPSCGIVILQTSVPEAMVNPDNSEKFISDHIETERFNALGIGPGMGTANESQEAMHYLLQTCNKPMVIDADALNILSLNPEWFEFLDEKKILTPHPKEFERLTHAVENGYMRLMTQIRFSAEHHCIVILKGAYTSITTPDGKVYFNSTGNPGMATGGTGDVLTGIVLSLLAQGYAPEKAAVVAVFIHGMAGDLAAEGMGTESMLASDLINKIGDAYFRLKT